MMMMIITVIMMMTRRMRRASMKTGRAITIRVWVLLLKHLQSTTSVDQNYAKLISQFERAVPSARLKFRQTHAETVRARALAGARCSPEGAFTAREAENVSTADGWGRAVGAVTQARRGRSARLINAELIKHLALIWVICVRVKIISSVFLTSSSQRRVSSASPPSRVWS